MLKIFLSYAHEDLAEARRLYEVLDSVPTVDVWFDKESLIPGEKWEHAIRKAIKESRFFILLLSSRSVSKRGFYQREVRLALNVLDEFPEDDIYVIPARLDECDPSFERLANLQYVDLFPDWGVGVTKIFRALKTHERPETKSQKATRVRFTTHQARFVSNPTLHYFLNITNVDSVPLEITHIWYEDAVHHVPVRRNSRPLPKRLEPSEVWSSWIPLGKLPQKARLNSYDRFKLRLSTGEVFVSEKEDTVPPYGSVPGGTILLSDIEDEPEILPPDANPTPTG